MSQTIQSGILPNYKHKFRRIKSLSWRDLKPFIQYPCNPSFPGAFQWECFWSISLKSFLDIITSSSWSRFESSDLIFESHSVSLLSLLWTLLVPYVFFFFFFFFFSFFFFFFSFFVPYVFFFFFFQNSMLSFSSEVEFVFSLLLTMRFFIEHSFIVSESSILLVLVYLVIASIKLSSFWFNLLFNFFHYIYKTFLNKVILSL